jgi:hypothetical protein
MRPTDAAFPALGRTNPNRSSNRPPRIRHAPVTSRGPRYLQKKTIHTGGPGQPPPDFVTNTTSASEWVIYWASKRAFDPDQDPRQPPFFGGRDWYYQSQVLSRIRDSHAKSVSTNVDFIYQFSYPYVAVRLQSYRFHEDVDAFKQAYDRIQLARLSGVYEVVDIYEEDFIGDPTGEAAILVVKAAVGLVRHQNPLSSFQTLLIRPGRNV